MTVFYSWQSDLPSVTNRGAIRKSLRLASSNLEEKYATRGLHVTVEEATRGEAGSPNIPVTILKKIDSSDVFVCDVTPVNVGVEGQLKTTPNPNVVFELGYAVAVLGWSRVILLFNECFGNFPDDLPFDLSRHRGSPYKLKAASDGKNQDRSFLDSLLTEAIEIIIQRDPPRPLDALASDPAAIKRQRDVKKLRWVLETIHWPTLQDHMTDAPHLIPSKVFHFWEGFHGVFENHLFQMYDASIMEQLGKIHELWGISLSFGEHYTGTLSGKFVFSNPGDMPLNTRQRKAWDRIAKALRDLHSLVPDFLRDIRARYLEIDIEETNKAAWLEFLEGEESFSKFYKQKSQAKVRKRRKP